MTLLDVIVLIIVVAAAIGGFRRLGGVARAGRLLGLVVGAGVGAAWGSNLARYGDTPDSAWLWGLVGVIAGLLLGSLVGGFLGGLVSRVLARGRLSFLDRIVGAVTGAVTALLVIWLVSWVVPAVVSAEALAPVTTLAQSLGGSRIVDSVSELLPCRSAPVAAARAPTARCGSGPCTAPPGWCWCSPSPRSSSSGSRPSPAG